MSRINKRKITHTNKSSKDTNTTSLPNMHDTPKTSTSSEHDRFQHFTHQKYDMRILDFYQYTTSKMKNYPIP